MITKLNRGRNARRVIKKPVLWNRRSRGCCMETSTLEDVISCRAPKCVADAKIYTMQLLLGQYWFTELHTTSYYTKWSAVIVLLHLTYQVFCVPESIFCLFFFGLLSCFLFFIRLTLDENVHVIVGWGNLNANFVFNLSLILLVFMTIECFLNKKQQQVISRFYVW
jgi:hypothetical protein